MAFTARRQIIAALQTEQFFLMKAILQMPDQTVIYVNQVGRMGNHMAQLMFAQALQRHCRRELVIEGYDLPDWGLSAPRTQDNAACDLTVGSHLTRAKYVAALIDLLKPSSLNIGGVIIREGNLTLPEDYDHLFPLDEHEGVQVPDDSLLINVRAGDVATPSHRDYGPLPISYYQYLVQHTGLKPVFMGEIDDTPYFDALRRTFADAEFMPCMGARPDFQTIRRARNIAISVSSFSWYAAFLSRAACIHVPVAGMLDPRTRSDVDMLPLHDPRFIFHEFGQVAWRERYVELFPSQDNFGLMPRSTVVALKRRAARKTFLRSTRIHLGLARRMLIDAVAG